MTIFSAIVLFAGVVANGSTDDQFVLPQDAEIELRLSQSVGLGRLYNEGSRAVLYSNGILLLGVEDTRQYTIQRLKGSESKRIVDEARGIKLLATPPSVIGLRGGIVDDAPSVTLEVRRGDSFAGVVLRGYVPGRPLPPRLRSFGNVVAQLLARGEADLQRWKPDFFVLRLAETGAEGHIHQWPNGWSLPASLSDERPGSIEHWVVIDARQFEQFEELEKMSDVYDVNGVKYVVFSGSPLLPDSEAWRRWKRSRDRKPDSSAAPAE